MNYSSHHATNIQLLKITLSNERNTEWLGDFDLMKNQVLFGLTNVAVFFLTPLIGAIGYLAQAYTVTWFFYWRGIYPFWPMQFGPLMFLWTILVGLCLGSATAEMFYFERINQLQRACQIGITTFVITSFIAVASFFLWLLIATEDDRSTWLELWNVDQPTTDSFSWTDILKDMIVLGFGWGLPFWWGLVLLAWSHHIKRRSQQY